MSTPASLPMRHVLLGERLLSSLNGKVGSRLFTKRMTHEAFRAAMKQIGRV